jgi:hypothetical protein
MNRAIRSIGFWRAVWGRFLPFPMLNMNDVGAIMNTEGLFGFLLVHPYF